MGCARPPKVCIPICAPATLGSTGYSSASSLHSCYIFAYKVFPLFPGSSGHTHTPHSCFRSSSGPRRLENMCHSDLHAEVDSSVMHLGQDSSPSVDKQIHKLHIRTVGHHLRVGSRWETQQRLSCTLVCMSFC